MLTSLLPKRAHPGRRLKRSTAGTQACGDRDLLVVGGRNVRFFRATLRWAGSSRASTVHIFFLERTKSHVEHIVVARRQHAHHEVEPLLNRIYVPVDDDHI